LKNEKLFQVCYERHDTENEKLLYKIGQGHIEKHFGGKSNLLVGISVLEKSISKGFERGERMLFLGYFNKRFGSDKTDIQLFEETRNIKNLRIMIIKLIIEFAYLKELGPRKRNLQIRFFR
jgi:hypothetical protein